MGIQARGQKLLSGVVLLTALMMTNAALKAQQLGLSSEAHAPTVLKNSKQRLNVRYDTYILGAGDLLQIELLDLPELSGEFKIGPDGTIYLPRLRALKVEGLTIEELRLFLSEQFRPYVRDPQVFITPIGYRPVRVYVGGEVARPGYYTIRGAELVRDVSFSSQQQLVDVTNSGAVRARPISLTGSSTPSSNFTSGRF